MKIVLSILLFVLTPFVMMYHGVTAAAFFVFAGSACLIDRPEGVPAGALLTPTLTPTLLLQQTMAALFIKCPALRFFSNEFTTERLKLNQQVIGKIRQRPVTSTYDPVTGYKNGSQESRDLLVDVPFVMDKHIHVTVQLSQLYALQDSIIKLREHFDDSASVIGSTVGRYILGKINSAAFSNSTTYTAGNSNKDMLNAVKKALNLRGVPEGRFGLVNSDVSETLGGDARITNRYTSAGNQDTDSQAYAEFKNIAGFQSIVEDPALGTGNGTALNITGVAATDIITTGAAHNLVVNQRVQIPTITGGAGITALDYAFVKTVPSSTTLTLSATRGGAALNFTTDISAGTLAAKENMTGFFGTREAIAIKTGLPTDALEAAQAFGIPVPVSSEVVTDPTTGLSMIAYKWFEVGTMNAYITLAVLYGATAGASMDASGLLMDPCGQILRSA